ncbi:MAG: DUF1989 domain-containing protein [Caldilineaceae bacterium]|nr:DUF1989 domain-containing protein [Caldilineaceae bacterium]
MSLAESGVGVGEALNGVARGCGDLHRLIEITVGEVDLYPLAPFGIAGDDIGDVFNLFMNVEFKPDGGFAIKTPETKAGDYIDLRAEMNIIAAVSACPNENNPVNNFRAKPLGMEVWEPA